MVVSPFGPRSSQYTFGCLSPSDWEKGKNWKRLPFSGVSHKTTFSSALSALNNGFLGWGFQYQTFSILSPSNRCALGEWTSKYFEAISFDRGLLTHYVCPNVFIILCTDPPCLGFTVWLCLAQFSGLWLRVFITQRPLSGPPCSPALYISWWSYIVRVQNVHCFFKAQKYFDSVMHNCTMWSSLPIQCSLGPFSAIVGQFWP